MKTVTPQVQVTPSAGVSIQRRRFALLPRLLPLLLLSVALGRAQVLPPAGIVGWWPGDNNANDIVGPDSGMFLGNGSPAYKPAMVGEGFDFDGTGSTYVLVPPVGSQFATGTVEFWLMVRSWNWTNSPNGMFVWAMSGCMPNSGSSWDWMNLGTHRGYTTNGDLMFGIFAKNDWQWAKSGVVPQPNLWYHVAGTWGRQGVKIYVDGVLRGTNAYTGAAPQGTCDVIGESSWAASAINGIVDEVSIYDRALTANELKSIYTARNSGKSRPCYWVGGQGNWSNPMMWSQPVGANSLVIIPSGSVTVDIPNAQAGSILVRYGAKMFVSKSSWLGISGQLLSSGDLGILKDSGFSSGGDVYVQDGTLTVDAGGVLAVTNAFDGGDAFTQVGGAVTINGSFAVSGLGAGCQGINIQNGTFNLSAPGDLTVDGTGSSDGTGLAQWGGSATLEGSATLTGFGSGSRAVGVQDGTFNVTSTGMLGLDGSSGGQGLAQTGGNVSLDGQLATTGSPGGLYGYNLTGGTLTGTGIIDGDLMADGGTIAPADAPGTLTITSNFIQHAGNTLLLQVLGSGAGQFDQLNVGGQASLGGTVTVWLRGGYLPGVGDEFPLLSCSSVTGAFSVCSIPAGISLNYGSVGISQVVTGIVSSQGVSFPNPGLEDSVRSALGLPLGPIAPSSLQTPFWLDVQGLALTSLGGLEAATGLTWLDASQNQLASIGPLAGCTNLADLYFDWNQVTNLDALAQLNQLQELSFSDNKVDSVAALANCTQLERLFFDWNQVTNLDALAGMTQLSELRLGGNQVASIAPLANLTNLAHLTLEWNHVGNIDALARMSPLQELRLMGNQIADLAPLADFTNLVHLTLEWNQVTNIDVLAGMTQLQELRLSQNQIANILPLAGCTNLTRLTLEGNQVTNIDLLAGTTQLLELRLTGNQIADLGPLAGLAKLVQLTLEFNQVTNIDALAGMTQLQELRLTGNHIAQLGPLLNLTNLVLLTLEQNQITSVDALAGMTQLQELRLSGNQISSLAPLANCASLKLLYLENNQVADIGALAGLKQLGELRLAANYLQHIEALTNLAALTFLSLANNYLDLTPGSAAMQTIDQLQNLCHGKLYAAEYGAAHYLVCAMLPRRGPMRLHHFSDAR